MIMSTILPYCYNMHGLTKKFRQLRSGTNIFSLSIILAVYAIFCCMNNNIIICFAAIPSSPAKPLASSMTAKMRKELKSFSSYPAERRATGRGKGRRERERERLRMSSWKQLSREGLMPSYQC